MFWALAEGRVDTRGFEFEHVLADIQTLNEWALEGRLEVTAISLHTYPYVQDRYALLPHGASMGVGLRAGRRRARAVSLEPLRELRDRDPGRLTTAFLVLRMALGDFRYREVPFDEILDEVSEGRAEAGLLIHEGQLHLRDRRAGEVPRPRRVVAARDGPAAAARRQRRAARPRRRRARRPRRPCCASRSRPGSTTASEALRYALRFGRGLDDELADRFVGMYVNELTCDYGEEGRQAVRELFARAEAAGALPEPVPVEFVG